MIGGIPFTLSLSKGLRASAVKFPSSVSHESLRNLNSIGFGGIRRWQNQLAIRKIEMS
jgi:hypothetical protein